MDTQTKDRLGKFCPALEWADFANMMDYRGVDRTSLVGRPIQGIYESSTTQNHLLGARRETTLGRIFRYAKATNIIGDCRFGLKFWDEIGDGVAYTAPLQTQLVGVTTIYIDAGAAARVTEDQYIGGYCIVHTGTDYDAQFREITGNSASDADGYITVTVDGGWTKAIETGYGVEIMPNPYGNVRIASSGGGGGTTPDAYSSVAGMAQLKTTAANTYLWLQTWGPFFVNPHGTAGTAATADRRGLVFDREGSISAIDESVSSDVAQQYAGFIMNRESVANGAGPPLVMLQITP